jgi:N-methylhydantoinase A
LKVGPQSAGADPGPASYGRGGTSPAVTDADLLLGNLDAGFFLGGDMALDVESAERAVGKVGSDLGTSAGDTAAGVMEVVNQNMAAAARMHAVERGVDLRGVSLIAFGGAGPVHACGVAELLEAPRVIFPVHASVLSAFGTLVSPVRIDLARSLVRVLGELDLAERDALLDELRAEARRILEAAGVPASAIRTRYGLDVRYFGQGNEITLWLGEGDRFPADRATIDARFDEEYERVYGMSIPGLPVEAVTWRLSAYADAPELQVHELPASGGTPMPHRMRPVRFDRAGTAADVPVYRREQLGAGATFAGPAIVEERETTAVIRPGWTCTVLPDGVIVASRDAAAPEVTA